MAQTLGVTDCIVLFFILALSLGIGIFFGCFEGRKKTIVSQTKEFLLGGRQMSALPVACSIMASFFSAITLLGVPNEIYSYGVMYAFIGLGYCFTITVSGLLFIPVFYNLDITSSYEYLSLRFSRVNQVFGALAFILQMTPYLGIVMYGPALALSVVININVWIVVVSMALVCITYTTIGGLKAVVWTDVLQLMMMFIGMIGVIIKGSIDADGFNKIMKTALDNERFTLDFSLDPRTRHSMWGIIIGGGFLWAGIYAINQTMVQRALCIKSEKQAKIAYFLNLPGLIALLIIVVLCGFVIFDFFNGCDPLISGEIPKSDQLLPLYVSKVLLQYPGVTGVFVAGIFSGGLSTLSSGLNSLAAVTLQDIIMLKYSKLNDKTATYISKSLVVVYGVLTLIFAYLSSLTNKILEAALGLFGMLSGPLIGVFSLGMFFPFGNVKGAISGHIVSQFLIFWIGFGFYANNIHHPKLVRSNFNCSGMGNVTIPTSYEITYGDHHEPIKGLQNLYAVSYMWYTFIGWAVSLLIGIPVSLLTGGKNVKVHKQLITPLLRNLWRNYLVADDQTEIPNHSESKKDIEEISRI